MLATGVARQRVVIAGGGVGGLTLALALGRAGHDVTVVERDPLPATADAEEAFAAERRGAPQVHQTHGFLARILVELRQHFPDVLDNGVTLAADVVVAAIGRRGDVPAWLGALGVDVPETVHESGLMYLTRWYRFPAGYERELDPKLGGDLQFVKYLAVPGDDRTLSITLALRPDDAALRRALSDPAGFEAACRILPGPNQFFQDGPLEPLGGVRPMTGLINRLRRFLDDGGRPTVLGFHALGDAHTCTNPLYGRGCSLALVQALRLAAAFDHHEDPEARAEAYEQALRHEVEPWFHSSVEMDRAGADPAGLARRGSGEQGTTGPARAMAAVFVAAATDPVIGQGVARLWNLLCLPLDLMADAELAQQIAAVMADPDAYPVPPVEGPTREELLAHLAGHAADTADDEEQSVA